MDTKALRQKILDLAIRGKLVPQDPNDEPASVLLERIRAEKQQMVKDGKLKPKDIKNDTIIFKGEDNLHYEKFPDGTVKCIEDEIPFELPEGWEWTRIFSVSFNLPYGTAKKSDSNGKVAVLRMGNLQNGEIDYSDLVYSSDDEDINQYELLENDLLFNRTNSAEWVGKTAIYRGGVKAIYAGYLIRLRTGLNAEYLNAVMNSQYERDYCNMVKTDGVNQSNINAQKLGSFLIPVPSISEQCRIVCKFNNLLSFIETIESDKTDLQTTIQLTKSKILDLAIRGKLVPQNPDDEPASVLLDRIRAEKEELIKQGKIKRDKKESVIFKGDDNSYYEKIGNTVTCIDEELPFELPKSWEWCNLSMIGQTNIGLTYSPADIAPDNGIIVFRSSNIINNQLDYSDLVRVNKSIRDNQYLANNDILICARNGSKALVGKCALIKNLSERASFGAFMAIYRTTFYTYVFYFLQTSIFRDTFHDSNSTAINQLTQAMIKKTRIPLPPFEEQLRIVEYLNKYFDLLNYIEKSLN